MRRGSCCLKRLRFGAGFTETVIGSEAAPFELLPGGAYIKIKTFTDLVPHGEAGGRGCYLFKAVRLR